jgi:hypothetical protein
MDLVDQAFDSEQEYIEHSKYNLKKKGYVRLKPQGFCHNCFFDLENPNQLFCNSLCAKQYEISSKKQY